MEKAASDTSARRTMMIQIGSPLQEPAPELLSAPGGFSWWYLDLIDPEGDGLVVIWSYGLPFLPGYGEGARRGQPQLPSSRPSVNIAVYSRGRPTFYLLQEYPETAADPLGDPARQSIGQSLFKTRTAGKFREVEIHLDCPVPGTGERLTGTIRAEGVSPDTAADPSLSPHLWTPLAGPATAEAQLSVGKQHVAKLRGRAYHDRNGSSSPLHELGIARWMWGRIPLPNRERIYYLLWPEDGSPPRAIGLEIDADGATRTTMLEVEESEPSRTLGGIRWPRRLRLSEEGRPWMAVRHDTVVDSGPFYLRYQSTAETEHDRARGWGELCVPGRVDLARHRPLVRMRVHSTDGPNSLWLPLFTGPRKGRLGRLLRHAVGSRG